MAPVPFFEPPPPIEPPERPPRPPWLGPPDGLIGEVAPLRATLVRSENLIVVGDRFVCYPSGFEFTLAVRMRHTIPGPRMIHGLGPAMRAVPGQPLPDDMLRFGVAFADGRKATNLAPRPFGPPGSGVVRTVRGRTNVGPGESEPEPPLLVPHGGSGGDRRWEQNCWVWGLPPEGVMGVVVEWPAEGIGETRVDLDADVIREAAERAEVIWET